MKKRVKGKVFKLGNDINTDYIIPARYLDLYEPEELGQHVLEGLGKEYPNLIKGHSILLAGENIGLGSAREQAPNALKGGGIQVVIAKSYARIFYRNTLNVGIAAIQAPEAVKLINTGDEVEVDVEEGIINARGKVFRFDPFPDQLRDLLEAGGMMPYLKKQLGLG